VLKEFYRVAFRNQNLPLAPKLQSVRQSQGQPICGHDRGAVNWNCLASLVETAKLHGLDPQSYLAARQRPIAKSMTCCPGLGGQNGAG
jgi:hypothetical protein